MIIENLRIHTKRMRLVPATAATVRAEMDNHKLLGALLQAQIPENWPPEQLRDALPFFLERMEVKPFATGWFGWYGIRHRTPDDTQILIASGGFLGEPVDGAAEIGYSVLPEYQRQGYATEMTGALLGWSLLQPGPPTIFAEVDEDNRASRALLSKLAFEDIGPGRAPHTLRYRWKGGEITIGRRE